MGADNWAKCPKCYKELRKKQEAEVEAKRAELIKTLQEKPSSEYIKLVNDFREKEEYQSENTFREDYEIGVDTNGEFEIVYRGECTECHYKFDYKFKQELP